MLLTLVALTSFCCMLNPLYAGGKPKTDEDAIKYIELGSDQGIYTADIEDGDVKIHVTKLSFGGDTTLDGIKKEQDSSINKINLGEITTIQMLDPLHDSIRYPQQEFCLVRISTLNGNNETMLMPRNLLICAESAQSRIKKSWSLRTLKSITIHHEALKKAPKKRITYQSF